jgi:hypothetical protein
MMRPRSEKVARNRFIEGSSLERGEVKGAVGYEFRKIAQDQVFSLKFSEIAV